jgi:hypothetical protein
VLEYESQIKIKIVFVKTDDPWNRKKIQNTFLAKKGLG